MDDTRTPDPIDAPIEDQTDRNAARPDQSSLREQLHGRDEGAPTWTGGDIGNDSGRSGFSSESAADRVGGESGPTH